MTHIPQSAYRLPPEASSKARQSRAVRNPQSQKTKVLHLITDLDPGGAEFMLFKLLSVMNQDSFENQVVSMTDVGIVGKKIEKLGFSVRSLGMRKGVPSFKGFRTFSRILNQVKPDIIQTWMYHADLLGVLAGKRLGYPKIIWNIRCSNMEFSKYRRLTHWVVKLCAWFSSFPEAVVVNSTHGHQYHLGLGYHPRRWETIPNGFDLQNFTVDHQARKEVRKELGLEENSFLIGMVARFDPMKDHQTFLSAAIDLIRKKTDVYFLLVGEWITAENSFFKTNLDNDLLGDHFFLLGYRDDIAKITAALDIATSSSYGEGFPNAIGEAMACGVPCVVTDVGDSAYLVGDTGLVIFPRNAQALAAAWMALLAQSVDERKILGRKARQRVEDLFEINKVAGKYEVLYRQLL